VDEKEAAMKSLILILITLFSFTAYANQVALTFDDLPCAQDMNSSLELEINQKILSALKKFNASDQLRKKQLLPSFFMII